MQSTFWNERGQRHTAHWHSENGVPAPAELLVVGDETRADEALAKLKRGATLLYRGDYRNARQLLSALSRRLEKNRPVVKSKELRDVFFADREAKAREAELLGRLCVCLDPEGRVECANAVEVKDAVNAAFVTEGRTVIALRELLGVLGAYEWRKSGIEVAAIGGRVHPHYGVFGPIRQEYVDLVARGPDVRGKTVFDVGTGTGVLSVLLSKRGASSVVATDLDPRAVDCARETAVAFGLADRIRVEQRDLFPEGAADVILFNPPWLPAKPKTAIDRAIYDEGGMTVRRFLGEAASRLNDGGEVWLVISDLAERLGIRRPGLLEELWTKGGLRLISRLDTKPTHRRSNDAADRLHAARSSEVTSLFVLSR